MDTASVTVNFPTPIAFSPSTFAVTCPGANDGGADPLVSGGTGSYTYQWSNGSTDAFIFLVAGGDYTVTATDANGCSNSTIITIPEPPVILAGELITNVSCNGFSDGAIDMNTSGGTPPFTFAWSNAETTEDISNLVAELYTVTITDASPCTSIFTFSVSAPTVIVINKYYRSCYVLVIQ